MQLLNEDGTAWKLNGEKQWITNAHMADVYVVFAKTNKGMTAFIVERTCEGVSIGLEEKKMGIKGFFNSDAYFRRCCHPR